MTANFEIEESTSGINTIKITHSSTQVSMFTYVAVIVLMSISIVMMFFGNDGVQVNPAMVVLALLVFFITAFLGAQSLFMQEIIFTNDKTITLSYAVGGRYFVKKQLYSLNQIRIFQMDPNIIPPEPGLLNDFFIRSSDRRWQPRWYPRANFGPLSFVYGDKRVKFGCGFNEAHAAAAYAALNDHLKRIRTI